MNARALAFEQQIERRVEQRHTETRTRLTDNYRMSVKAASEATSARETVEAHTARAETRIDGLSAEIRSLVGEVRGWAGQRQGEAAAQDRFTAAVESEATRKQVRRDRWMKGVSWAVGVGGAAPALWKVISAHIHRTK